MNERWLMMDEFKFTMNEKVDNGEIVFLRPSSYGWNIIKTF